jgi:capsular polysaccharide transport system ATP-binding protein
MIAMQHVTKSYPTNDGVHVVLNDISATFEPRVSVGLVGKNGAGKSTLLRLLAGIEMPDVGTIERSVRISWPLGFSGGFNVSLSGEENCRFVARIYDEDIDRVVGFAQEFSELGKYFYMPVKTYSSGMRGRLAFGLSMAVDFDVYLVDEITSVGDASFQAKSRKAFRERRDRSSLILVSHNMETIREHCDRGAVLQDGALTIYDTVDKAAKAYRG